ncbi:MAG: agmatine deiminase family protein [Acidobacteria bacterium]|nr:agmatine deiminase family protein [Acidobacteriota bacterium]
MSIDVRDLGLRQPAEWEPHESVWLAWPSHEDLWQESLGPVQDAFVELCRGISVGGTGERIDLLLPFRSREAEARERLEGMDVRFHAVPFGDIWLRDTAPIFLTGPDGVAAASFRFNGWGGKYVLPHDAEVSARVAALSGLPTHTFDLVLEGGSVEVDGQGTCLTTRQCLLNENRNPGLSESDIEIALRRGLGVETILWLGDGLLNDHTDGHIDTIARYVAPGVVVCMEPAGADDPNRDVLEAIARDLAAMRDHAGRRLQVVRVPSPGLVEDEDGEVMPASYVNFYIGNAGVVVPVYGTRHDDEAVRRIGELFPGRRTIGAPARRLLEGGGAFHCISQQQPVGKTA